VKLTFSRIILVSPKKAPSSATGREREREVSDGLKLFKSLQHQGQGQGQGQSNSNSSSSSNTPPMQYRKVPHLHTDQPLPLGPLSDPPHTQPLYSSSLSEYASRSSSRPDSGSKIRRVKKRTPGTVSSPQSQSDSLSSSRSPFASTDTAEFVVTNTHR
jgi:hypothetical protein